MKVELEKLELGCSPLTGEVFIGTLKKSRTQWINKVNVTNGFLDCVIKRWENETEQIVCGSHVWQVTVKKIK